MTPAAVVLLLPAAAATDADTVTAKTDRDKTNHGGFVPSVGLGFGAFDETLRLRIGGVDHDESRGETRTAFALGLAHPVWTLGSRAWIDGHASLGVGVTFHGGHWQLPFREDVTVAYEVSRWLTLRGGLGLGAVYDATRTARSYLEIGVPLSATFARVVEVVYRPFLSLPLGSEDSAVFGGSRSLDTSVAVVPLDIALRFRVPALTFGR